MASALTHQTLNLSAHQAKKMLNVNFTAAYYLIISLIWTIYVMILKHPQNGSSKDILLSCCPGLATRETYSGRGGGAIYTSCSCSWSSPQLGKFVKYCSRTRQDTVETANLRLCTGTIGELMTEEKMDRCSCVEVGQNAKYVCI